MTVYRIFSGDSRGKVGESAKSQSIPSRPGTRGPGDIPAGPRRPRAGWPGPKRWRIPATRMTAGRVR